MILAEPLLGVDETLPRWRILLIVSQVGAILAVVVYFRRDLWRRLTVAPTAGWSSHLLTKLIVGVTPAMIMGVLIHDALEKHLEKPVPVAMALIAGAVAMEGIDRRFRRTGDMTLDDVTLRQAALIGLIQCVSMWPGISRAAATIMGGMIVGLTPRVAAEFSFYLAIPTMLAAGAYRLFKYHHDLTRDTVAIVLIGSTTAFAVAMVVVASFLGYVQRRRFTPFAVYRVILGAVVLIYFSAAR